MACSTRMSQVCVGDSVFVTVGDLTAMSTLGFSLPWVQVKKSQISNILIHKGIRHPVYLILTLNFHIIAKKFEHVAYPG